MNYFQIKGYAMQTISAPIHASILWENFNLNISIYTSGTEQLHICDI